MMCLLLHEARTFEQWNHVMLHAYDDPPARQAAAKNILGYLDEFVGRRMTEGPAAADDLLSVLLRADVDGRPLDRDELLDYAFMLFMAGRRNASTLLQAPFRAITHPPAPPRLVRGVP